MRSLTSAIDHWFATTFGSADIHEGRQGELSLASRGTRRPAWLDIEARDWKDFNCLRYRSEAELKSDLAMLDRMHGTELVVVLQLSERIRTSLKGLLHRRNPAARLIVVGDFNYWPGTDSPLDLLRSDWMLGWNAIEIRRSGRTPSAVPVDCRSNESVLCALLPAES